MDNGAKNPAKAAIFLSVFLLLYAPVPEYVRFAIKLKILLFFCNIIVTNELTDIGYFFLVRNRFLI